ARVGSSTSSKPIPASPCRTPTWRPFSTWAITPSTWTPCLRGYSENRMQLRLNPRIDLKRASREYAKTGVAQIADVFDPDQAGELAAILEKALPWGLAFQGQAGPKVYNRQQLQAVDQQHMRAELKAMLERTGQGYGFMYLCYPMISAYLQRW